MILVHSKHWTRKRRFRKDITDDVIEYAIANSNVLRDKHWEDASNAICRVPPIGRILKVVYRQIGRNEIKLITAYWLD